MSASAVVTYGRKRTGPLTSTPSVGSKMTDLDASEVVLTDGVNCR